MRRQTFNIDQLERRVLFATTPPVGDGLVGAYYDDKAQIAKLLDMGVLLQQIGQHASIIDTSELMSINPKGVDLSRYRSMTLGMEPNGASGDPRFANAELGADLLRMRVAAAANQIKALLATQ